MRLVLKVQRTGSKPRQYRMSLPPAPAFCYSQRSHALRVGIMRDAAAGSCEREVSRKPITGRSTNTRTHEQRASLAIHVQLAFHEDMAEAHVAAPAGRQRKERQDREGRDVPQR